MKKKEEEKKERLTIGHLNLWVLGQQQRFVLKWESPGLDMKYLKFIAKILTNDLKKKKFFIF